MVVVITRISGCCESDNESSQQDEELSASQDDFAPWS